MQLSASARPHSVSDFRQSGGARSSRLSFRRLSHTASFDRHALFTGPRPTVSPSYLLKGLPGVPFSSELRRRRPPRQYPAQAQRPPFSAFKLIKTRAKQDLDRVGLDTSRPPCRTWWSIHAVAQAISSLPLAGTYRSAAHLQTLIASRTTSTTTSTVITRVRQSRTHLFQLLHTPAGLRPKLHCTHNCHRTHMI